MLHSNVGQKTESRLRPASNVAENHKFNMLAPLQRGQCTPIGDGDLVRNFPSYDFF